MYACVCIDMLYIVVNTHGDGSQTARARLESDAATRALNGGAGRGGREGSVGGARKGTGRSGNSGRSGGVGGSTWVDAELEELRNLQRASLALEEAVEEDRQKKERERDRMRLKRIRLREAHDALPICHKS